MHDGKICVTRSPFDGPWNGVLRRPAAFVIALYRRTYIQYHRTSRHDSRCQIWIELRPSHAHLRFFLFVLAWMAGWQTTDLVF